jgi:hypothetical protein
MGYLEHNLISKIITKTIIYKKLRPKVFNKSKKLHKTYVLKYTTIRYLSMLLITTKH